jgi:hypothetical protein
MEEGSLLREALRRRGDGAAAADDSDSDDSSAAGGSVLLDVFLLDRHRRRRRGRGPSTDDEEKAEHLLALADVCVDLNRWLLREGREAAEPYPWMAGGDGLAFGVHATTSGGGAAAGSAAAVPHLRGRCRCGASVADGWRAVGLLLGYTAARRDGPRPRLAVECWDVADGQVLLIEAAEHLPAWVDRIGPERCRRRCWIVNGSVRLIAPSSAESKEELSLAGALQLLAEGSERVSSPPAVNRVIRETVDRVASQQHLHRAAIAVPRSVAVLLRNRPDLVATASGLFAEQAATKQPLLPADASPPLLDTCRDWVWTTARLGRTQYAMLRTIVSSPVWKTEDAIPSRYSSVEVKRLVKQCARAPHLRYGVQLGVRLTAGLDHSLAAAVRQDRTRRKESADGRSLAERRALRHWTRICQQTGGGNWVAEAWRAGPHRAAHDLDSVLKAPAYEEEVKVSVTPLSHPEKTVSEQIAAELRAFQKKRDCFADEFDVVPGPDQVDDEAWMVLPSEEEALKSTGHGGAKAPDAETTDSSDSASAPLDGMLAGMETFMRGKSGVEGVAHDDDDDDDDEVPDKNAEEEEEPVRINPRVFLHLLHTVLKAESVDDLAFLSATCPTNEDPFFSEEDYELMEPEEEQPVNDEMVDLMEAMDSELLRSEAVSRRMDTEGIPVREGGGEVAEGAHVLSNLLQSIDAGGGGPGPVRNILEEMGIEAPELPAAEGDDGEKWR